MAAQGREPTLAELKARAEAGDVHAMYDVGCRYYDCMHHVLGWACGVGVRFGAREGGAIALMNVVHVGRWRA